jgi:plasmid stabilization system protein ParE
MTVTFHQRAEVELRDAVEYYDAKRRGLGDEFSAEVESTAARIAEFPNAWPRSARGTRHCRMNRFPYTLVYQIRADHILIVAVMHLHRRPGYWRDRV